MRSFAWPSFHRMHRLAIAKIAPTAITDNGCRCSLRTLSLSLSLSRCSLRTQATRAITPELCSAHLYVVLALQCSGSSSTMNHIQSSVCQNEPLDHPSN